MWVLTKRDIGRVGRGCPKALVFFMKSLVVVVVGSSFYFGKNYTVVMKIILFTMST